VNNYPNLNKLSKIPQLAIKLAKEAYFGKQIMILKGTGRFHALPTEPMYRL